MLRLRLNWTHLHLDLEVLVVLDILLILQRALGHDLVDDELTITVNEVRVKPEMEELLLLLVPVIELYHDVVEDEHLVLRVEFLARDLFIVVLVAVDFVFLVILSRILRWRLIVFVFFTTMLLVGVRHEVDVRQVFVGLHWVVVDAVVEFGIVTEDLKTGHETALLDLRRGDNSDLVDFHDL